MPADPRDGRSGGAQDVRPEVELAPRSGRGPASASSTVLQGGRRKAFRPLAREAIDAAVAAGLAAYERDDWFEAHELLEPAWMGTDVLAERELYQGLIKLAAGCVHRIRGNREGMARNLRGARERLSGADPTVAARAGVDLPGLLTEVDAALAALAAGRPLDAVEPPVIRPPSLPR